MAGQGLEILRLDDFQEYFASPDALRQFAEVLRGALQHDLRPITFQEQLIGATLSPAGAKDVLADRMVKRMKERPELLTLLCERLQDEIVE